MINHCFKNESFTFLISLLVVDIHLSLIFDFGIPSSLIKGYYIKKFNKFKNYTPRVKLSEHKLIVTSDNYYDRYFKSPLLNKNFTFKTLFDVLWFYCVCCIYNIPNFFDLYIKEITYIKENKHVKLKLNEKIKSLVDIRTEKIIN